MNDTNYPVVRELLSIVRSLKKADDAITRDTEYLRPELEILWSDVDDLLLKLQTESALSHAQSYLHSTEKQPSTVDAGVSRRDMEEELAKKPE